MVTQTSSPFCRFYERKDPNSMSAPLDRHSKADGLFRTARNRAPAIVLPRKQNGSEQCPAAANTGHTVASCSDPLANPSRHRPHMAPHCSENQLIPFAVLVALPAGARHAMQVKVTELGQISRCLGSLRQNATSPISCSTGS